MLKAMRIVAERGITPAAIGVDTWGVDYALLDEQDRLLEDPRSYRDTRIAGLAREFADRIGAARLHAATGSMFNDHNTLFQLLAAQRYTPELLGRAKLMLFIPDLLRHWLCGTRDTDCTFASTSQMYDAVGRQWATDILDELHLPTQILPEVKTGPFVAGRLCERIRRETGMGDVPVVGGAGHDTGAAFGICRGPNLPPPEDLAVISTGTWAIAGVHVDRHLPQGRMDPYRFGYESNPDGSMRIIRNLVGGWLIERCRAVWSAAGVDCSYGSLIAAARAAAGTREASAVIDPQSKGFHHPDDMPAAVVEHCRQTGQPAPRTPGEFSRVIFTSLAHNYARTIEELRQMTGWPLRNLYLVGGMTQNAYLNELTEQTAGVKVLLGPAEATALGNIAVQRAAVK
jgi:rhamnulokinase